MVDGWLSWDSQCFTHTRVHKPLSHHDSLVQEYMCIFVHKIFTFNVWTYLRGNIMEAAKLRTEPLLDSESQHVRKTVLESPHESSLGPWFNKALRELSNGHAVLWGLLRRTQ